MATGMGLVLSDKDVQTTDEARSRFIADLLDYINRLEVEINKNRVILESVVLSLSAPSENMKALAAELRATREFNPAKPASRAQGNAAPPSD